MVVSAAAASSVQQSTPSVSEGPESRRLACGVLGWHAHAANQDGCTDDEHYPEQWAEPHFVENFFYDTVEECCVYFFRNEPCTQSPSACGSPPDPAPALTPAPVPVPAPAPSGGTPAPTFEETGPPSP